MFGEGGDKNSKEGGWIYCLNNSIELVLIALHILCDGKTTVPKGRGEGGGWKDTLESFYGGTGEEGEEKKYLLWLRSM